MAEGWQSTNGIALNDIWEYTSSNNTWSQKASFPGSPRYTASCFVIGIYAYYGLGYAPYMNDFWRYDPLNNVWMQIANFPGTARQSAVAFSAGGFGFVGTGANGQMIWNDLYKYDPQINTWSTIAPFPGLPRYGSSSFTIDNIGYVGTGGQFAFHYNDFYAYDYMSNQWKPIAPFPGIERRHAVHFLIGMCGYIACGVTGNNNIYLNDLWEYGPSPISIPETNFSVFFSLFPNPASSVVNIHFSSAIVSDAGIDLYDSSGRLVRQLVARKGTSSVSIDVSSLPVGRYFIKVSAAESQKPVVTSLVVQRAGTD